MRKFQLFIKRTFDIIIGSVALVILSPIFLIIAVLIKLTSEGPVFFLQERIGLHGRVFRIIKFRTMIVNAEHIGEGIRVSSENDSRITKVGRFLRATSLDELPQLLNVIAGSMSICGPRPPVTYVPYEGYDNYPDEAKKRFEMRPGITGLAQATVRNSATWSERIIIDLQYVKNYNLWLDIKVIALTIIRVFKSEAIYGTSVEQPKDKIKEKVEEQTVNSR
ncbi:MAG: sugar transferase [Clostridia bacterium]|nr:sugar transferase [Clostridia bacterium]